MPTLVIKDGAENDQSFNVIDIGSGVYVWPHHAVNASGAAIGVAGSPWHMTTSFTVDYDSGAGAANVPVIGIALPGSGGPVAGGTAANPLNVTFSAMPAADYDTGGGTQNVSMVGIALPASGGAVAGGTVANPFNVTFSGLTLADFDSGGGTSNVNLVGLALPGSGGPVVAGTSANPLTVTPKIASGGNLKATLTNGTSTFIPFGNQACSRLLLINATGQTIEFERGGAGDAVPVLNGMSVPIEGLTNANQIGVRRLGVNNAGEVIGAVWEA